MKAKYREKPAVVEAEQFVRDRVTWPDGVEIMTLGGIDEDDVGFTYDNPAIMTPAGLEEVNEGDWILTDADGKKRVCNAETFERTFDKVEE